MKNGTFWPSLRNNCDTAVHQDHVRSVGAGLTGCPGLHAAGSLLVPGVAGRGLYVPVPKSAETHAHLPPRLPLEGLDNCFLFNTFSSIHFDRIYKLSDLGGNVSKCI